MCLYYLNGMALVDFPSKRTCTKKEEKLVSFAKQSQVMFVKNLTNEHGLDLWYTEQEIDEIKCRFVTTIRLIRSGMTMADFAQRNINDTSVFLGLENHLTESEIHVINQRRRAISNSVLLEQDGQLHLGIYDPDAMVRVSEAESLTCLDSVRELF